MGTCYSGLGSKASSTQTPIDPKNKQIVRENSFDIEFKVNANKAFDCKQLSQLSTSFENISVSEVKDRKRDKHSMSSHPNRQKIPIPLTKAMANNKVVPKGSQELAFNKYKTRRYEAPVDVNKVMIFDNSSTTSISSDCSVNLPKFSQKSTSSSTSNIARPQTSIPKPLKSRTPTPPIPIKYAANARKDNSTQHQLRDNCNKLSQNSSSLISDCLNGNEVNVRNDNKIRNKIIVSNESNASQASNGPVYGTSIKYTTQLSGLPRPQTAHIVSTSSHSSDKTISHRINASNDIESMRFKQYSDNKSQNVKCDQNLRQLKPYYYGMNKPYERPNDRPIERLNSFNANRLQFQTQTQSQPPFQSTNQTKPVFGSAFNSQIINQKQNSIASNGSIKSNLDFGSNHYQSIKSNFIKRDDTSIKDIGFDNKNQNFINSKSIDRIETNEDINNKKSNENIFLPKSIQRVKELAPLFARRTNRFGNKTGVKNEKPVAETSPEHNSISSVGTGSEAENRDFLIDDEISDQPELVLNSNINKNDLMKSLNSELEGLMLKQDLSASPGAPSSPNVSLSTASSASTVVPNATTFRKPRPLSLVEMPDGSYGLDSPSFRAACQDLIGIKTLLFRLHGLLQNAETLNPFEHNYSQNKFYQQLVIAENDGINAKDNDLEALQTENMDLKRQIVLQQQIIEDKDRTIRLLQQQMAKYSNINNAYVSQNIRSEQSNASSQTDRCNNSSNINPRAVSDGSNGMLVSVCCSHLFEANK